MALGYDVREADPRNGRKAATSRVDEYLDDAGREPSRYGTDRNQDAGRNENPGNQRRRDSTTRDSSAADSVRAAAGEIGVCGARLAGLLRECRSKPSGSDQVRPGDRWRAAGRR